ncbi:MAG TPA: RecQ family ATP-dependent DNA helicase [bacterium]|jgi:ATP-dependent DNA helicase RecQ|nr:MAG: ATP-dependent DNA helicase RecQ [Parcubacteria group bacterium ADurb.Bin016]HNU89910.1 RecQ family ATP-dependent DNA helicase [bacterium]HPU92116.1 RecQ family ATP-dependent DNA helicase [bacterium]
MSNHEKLNNVLKNYFHFTKLRPGQELAIISALQGQDTIVIMPTGGGKSLCFQSPALILPGITMVISPLIALMKDQVDHLNALGIPATFINSSLTADEASERLQGALNKKYRLIYIAPERFYNQSFFKAAQQLPISLIAVDEAHCISQWGHDFRPSYLQLKKFIAALGRPPIMALTATATPEVREDIIKQLDLHQPQEIITGFARPNLNFEVISTADSQKREIVLETIQQYPNASGIVYVSTRQRADELVRYLQSYHIAAIEYHAGLSSGERQALQNTFMNGRAKVIVATNAFGLGIDKPDLRFVIHYDMPGTIEAYYQEAGRAGRDGKPSLCLLLHSPRDRYLQEFFIAGDNPPVDLILNIYEFLNTYPNDHILITYSTIKNALGLDTPDLAVGTALKILEREGYLAKTYEKTSQAMIQLASKDIKLVDGQKALGTKAKKSLEIWEKLYDRYNGKLRAGLYINLDTLASSLGYKKDSLARLLKKLNDQKIIIYEPPFKGTEITLLKRCPREAVNLDHEALKTKLALAQHKLDQMENYVYHRGCRQQYILNYFGEHLSAGCGQCDWCKGSLNTYLPNYQHKISQHAPHHKSSFNIQLSTKLTQLTTLELYQKGLNLQEIARERQLQSETIIEHFCYLLEKGLITNIDQLIDENIVTMIQDLLAQKPLLTTNALKIIKEQLPSYVDWADIKLTLAYLQNNKSHEPKAS